MPGRYSFEDDTGEREPLDNHNRHYPPSASRGHQQYQQQQHYQQQLQYQQQQQQHQQQQYEQDYQQQHAYHEQQPPQPQPRARPANGPGSHPDSTFNQMAAGRRYSRDRSMSGGGRAPHMTAGAAAAAGAAQHHDVVSPISPPQPPPHHDNNGRYWGHEIGYAPPSATQRQPPNNITPGVDNFGETAAGGMAGIAYSVAERNARESGLEAMRGTQQPGYPQQAYQNQYQNHGYRHEDPYDQPTPGSRRGGYTDGHPADRNSHSSLQGLGATGVTPGQATPGLRTPSRSPHSFGNDVYTDDPYQGYSRGQNPNLGVVNPNDIEDDGDDGLVYGRSRGARTSMLSLGGQSNRSGRSGNNAAAVAAGAAGGAAAGGVLGTLGGLVGRSAAGPSGQQYNPVHNSTAHNNSGYQGSGGSTYDLGNSAGGQEKSEWLSKQKTSHKKWKWLIVIIIVLVIGAGIACGVVFGVVLKNKNNKGAAGGGSSSQTAAGDTAANGDLDINSAEIQGLMNNGNLHKVFPGVDYTPVNTQYPDCLASPPSQNNVTRDVAVLSQLTNTIRLYGTDCNQTEMAIHAIRQLKLQNTVKIWLGVWQDNNKTTNARQLAQMWNILDAYGAEPFKGIIVANEILFRQQMTASELGLLLSAVRTNLTSKGISLPVATSDLGDKWDSTLASVSDYIMANIHPFFAGENAKTAAGWTWSFWQNKASSFFKADNSKNIIAETGWPSQGGTACGTDLVTNCPDRSVAGIEQMNKFMADWVCQALSNGTQYFWFEAFDEPWKVRFNTNSQNWEDHWGLMDVDRNLKDGVQIPDCGGKTV